MVTFASANNAGGSSETPPVSGQLRPDLRKLLESLMTLTMFQVELCQVRDLLTTPDLKRFHQRVTAILDNGEALHDELEDLLKTLMKDSTTG